MSHISVAAGRPVRVVVVGAGHLGSYHVAKVLASPRAILVAVVDPCPARRERAAQLAASANPGAPAPSLHGHLGEAGAAAIAADAAIVAAPTLLHPELACAALARGWHVLVEKPLAANVAGCHRILEAAARAGRAVQVGHLERYNPAVQAALPDMRQARYVVAERLGPFSGRSTEVDVVLDLMVHDLDLLAHALGDEVVEVRAVGVPVLTDAVDMASARLVFAHGAVAQLTAGRVSLAPCRKLRLFGPERYVSVDCLTGEAKAVRRLPSDQEGGWPKISGEMLAVGGKIDALAAQDEDFFCAVAEGRSPSVDGEAGLRAVRLAEAVKRACAEQPGPPAPPAEAYSGRTASVAGRAFTQAAQLATGAGLPAL